jgi:hypothetical protein
MTQSLNAMMSTTLIGKKARSAPGMIQLTEGEKVSLPLDLLSDASRLQLTSTMQQAISKVYK